jgi:hypothetical protein
MSCPVFTIFPGLKDKLDPFPIGATTFRDFAHDRAKGAKALEYTRCLDRRLLPLPGSLQQLAAFQASTDLRQPTDNSTSAAECSISPSLPNGASPPDRDPGAQTVAGRETKSKQDSYVRQHRMFPQAIPRPLAIVVPS